MDQSEIARKAIEAEVFAFMACTVCAGEVAHTSDGMSCAKKLDCGLLQVNRLRGATGPSAETMLATFTEGWAMSHVGGVKLNPVDE